MLLLCNISHREWRNDPCYYSGWSKDREIAGRLPRKLIICSMLSLAILGQRGMRRQPMHCRARLIWLWLSRNWACMLSCHETLIGWKTTNKALAGKIICTYTVRNAFVYQGRVSASYYVCDGSGLTVERNFLHMQSRRLCGLGELKAWTMPNFEEGTRWIGLVHVCQSRRSPY